MKLLELERLIVGYHGRPVLGPVDLVVQPGEFWLILGHNGAGKSTLLRTIFGLLAPVEGTATVLGLKAQAITQRKLVIAGARYLAQRRRVFTDLTVARHRRLLYDLHGFTGPAYTPLDDPEIGRGRAVGQLSGGQQRLEAMAMLSRSGRLFLLDEPLVGVDTAHKEVVQAWVQTSLAAGAAFLVVEHDSGQWWPLVTNVLVIRSGCATFAGSKAALTKQDDWLVRFYV